MTRSGSVAPGGAAAGGLGKVAEGRVLALERAAKVVQSRYRGHVVRTSLGAVKVPGMDDAPSLVETAGAHGVVNRAAGLLESGFDAEAARHRAALDSAARVVQSRYRGHAVRKSMGSVRMPNMDDAASLVDSRSAGKLVSRALAASEQTSAMQVLSDDAAAAIGTPTRGGGADDDVANDGSRQSCCTVL